MQLMMHQRPSSLPCNSIEPQLILLMIPHHKLYNLNRPLYPAIFGMCRLYAVCLLLTQCLLLPCGILWHGVYSIEYLS
jgi:hypothetical protein